MMDKWLFDTGGGLTCMSTQQFWQILKEKRPTKLTLIQREARGASGAALIPDGGYLFPVEWSNKLVVQPVPVFNNITVNLGN
jgi:hypothetical protein